MNILEQASDSNDIPCRIVGIFLVRNEERFLEQAVYNVLNFCDELFLVDHKSSDQTVSICEKLQLLHPEKISFYSIQHPSQSQGFLHRFIGTQTWIFGIDGDELYDPEKLLNFRTRILAGEFDQEWMVLGNVLHVDELNEAASSASGYLAPPSRSITKLYNFGAIDGWRGETLERLHGGEPQFRVGFHQQKKRLLQHEYSWENSPLRCLHLCFLKRRSIDHSAQRQNIMEKYNSSFFSWIKKAVPFLFPKPTSWKEQHYARGERVKIDTTPFFKNR